VSAGEYRKPLYRLPTVLGVDDLSRALRVGDDTVRELVAAGRLRRLAYSSRSILVACEEVKRFLRDETIGPPAEPIAEPIAEPPADQDSEAAEPPRPAPHRKGTRWPLDAQGGAID
jgi:hypothetical protein